MESMMCPTGPENEPQNIMDNLKWADLIISGVCNY